MTKKIAVILTIILSTGFLGGCWDRRELNEVAIVLGTGVDLTEDNQLRLTVQLAKPAGFAGGNEGAQGQGAPTWVVSAEGQTILEAERNLSMKVSRQIYWGHNIILILGEKLARQEGTRIVSNYFQRANEPRETVWIMVTPGEAKEILETSSELEKSSAQHIGFIIKMMRGISVNLKDFAEMLANKEVNAVATLVEVLNTGANQESGPGAIPPPSKTIAITGTAVFKDDKMVGWLNNSETSSLLWLKNKIEKGVITVSSPGEPERKVSIRIASETFKIEPEYDGENLMFNIKIATMVDVLEQQSKENLISKEKKNALENQIAESIRAGVTEVLEKAQGEYVLDIFGFGSAFHRKYKREWHLLKDRWDQEFSQALVNIQVEVDIRGFGKGPHHG